MPFATGRDAIEKSARALIDNARREADENVRGTVASGSAAPSANRDDELAAIDSNRQRVLESLKIRQAGVWTRRLIVVAPITGRTWGWKTTIRRGTTAGYPVSG